MQETENLTYVQTFEFQDADGDLWYRHVYRDDQYRTVSAFEYVGEVLSEREQNRRLYIEAYAAE